VAIKQAKMAMYSLAMGNCLDKEKKPDGVMEKTWGKPATGPTFNSKYPIEFRKSLIEGAGNGTWALVDIPKGTRLRRVAVADGTLLRFQSEKELKVAGWDIDDAVNYGIGHFADPSSIYFLNPGTAMNHADKTREQSVKYVHDEEGVLELWTVKDVKAGEEMFNQYHKDFAPCKWYDELQRSRGNVPLSQLNDYISAMYDEKAIPKTWGKPATGPTFNSKYPVEFRKSQIEGAGNGTWALVDIPKGTRLRRVSVADGTLVCFSSEEELKVAGWDIDDAVNYGIGHFADPSSIYFLNPGTAMNHADKTRKHSVKYVHDEMGVLELWTVKDVKAGEELFNQYHQDFAPCKWYDELQRSQGNVPLSQLNDYINALYDNHD